jgi:hypothetical protein
MLIQSVTKIEEGRYKITSPPCPECSTYATLEIDGASLFLANQGAFVQKVLPNEPQQVREKFVSGYCGVCWDRIFANDKEEE